MDFVLLAIVFGITAILLGFFIYVIMIKIFETESIKTFVFALLMLIISELMIVFLMVLCIFKITGIA